MNGVCSLSLNDTLSKKLRSVYGLTDSYLFNIRETVIDKISEDGTVTFNEDFTKWFKNRHGDNNPTIENAIKDVCLYHNELYPDINFDFDNTNNNSKSAKYGYKNESDRIEAFKALGDVIAVEELKRYDKNEDIDKTANYNYYKNFVLKALKIKLLKSITNDKNEIKQYLKKDIVDLINFATEHISDNNIISNYIAVIKELTSDESDMAFKQIFANPKISRFIYEPEETDDVMESRDDTNGSEDSQNPEDTDGSQDDTRDKMAQALYGSWDTKDFMENVDPDLVLFFNAIPKLTVDDSKSTPVKDNALGFTKTMSAREVVDIIHQVGYFKDKKSFVAALKLHAKNISEDAGIITLAEKLEKDDNFFNLVIANLGQIVINKISYIQKSKESESKQANESTSPRTSLLNQFYNNIRWSGMVADNAFVEYLVLKAENIIKEPGTDQSKRERKIHLTDEEIFSAANVIFKMLSSYFPSVQEQAIINYIKYNQHNDKIDTALNAEELIGKVKNFINFTNEIQNQRSLDYEHTRQLQTEINALVEAEGSAKEIKDRKEIQEKYKNKDYITSNGYLKKEINGFVTMILPYTAIKTELNHKNEKGNNVTDIADGNMLTYLQNLLNDDELLNKWGNLKFRCSQYDYSNFLLEHTGVNKGLFRIDDDGKYVPTEYAKDMFKVSKFNGVGNEENGKNAVYHELNKNDYLTTAYGLYHTAKNKYATASESIANYFIRIPSDAPTTYIITAPKYSTHDVFLVDDNSYKQLKEYYDRLITKVPFGDKEKFGYGTISQDTFNKLLNGEDIPINVNDKKSYKKINTGEQDLKLSVRVGDNKFVTIQIHGTVYQNNDRKYIIRDKKFGFNIDKDNTDTQKVIDNAINANAGHKVNTNSVIFKQLKNVYKEELVNAAVAIDTIFNHKNGMIFIDEKTKDYEYKDEFVDKNVRNTKLAQVYHIRDNKYGDIKETGLVQNHYVKDEEGNWILDVNKETGKVKKILSGRVFGSDRFTLFKNGEFVNYGDNLFNELFDLLSSDKYLPFSVNDGKVTLNLSEDQESAIDNMISTFITDYTNDSLERFGIVEKYVSGVNTNKDMIVDFSLNYYLMYNTFSEILEGDSKYYKDSQTFLKRAKEMIAGGKLFGMFDMNNFNNEEIKEIDSDLNKTEFEIKHKDGTTEKFNVKSRNGFNAITVENSIKTSPNATLNNTDENSLFSVLTNDYSKLGFSEEDAKKAANNILKLYQNTKINDAQSYITFEEFIRRIYAKGQFNKYKPLIERILDETKPIDPKDIKEFVQLQKCFYYDIWYNPLLRNEMPRQIKNAEFVLIPRFIKGTELEVVYNLMKEHGIDQLNTTETSKAGKNYILKLWDNNGNLKEDVLNDYENGTKESDFMKYAAEAKQPFSYNFLYTQLETVQHIDDTVNKFAIQIAKKIFDNIDDSHPCYNDKKLFFKLYGEKIKRSAFRVFKDLGIYDKSVESGFTLDANGRIAGLNYEMLFKKFETELIRTGFDENLMAYITLDGDNKISTNIDSYPRTLMPLTDNLVYSKLESISQSIFNNSVTRQKLSGYHGAQVTSVGFQKLVTKVNEREMIDKLKGKDLEKYLRNSQSFKDYFNKIKHRPLTDNVNIGQEIIKRYKLELSANIAKEKIETDQGTVQMTEKKGIATNNRLQYHPNGENVIEIMLPRTAFAVNWFKDNGELRDDKEVLEELKAAGLDEHVIYRIPTEGKQSCCVARVVGFIDAALGSTIVVPDDWVSQTGSDFDIDSVYSITYKTRLNKENKIEKISYKEHKDFNKYDWYEYVNRNRKEAGLEKIDYKIKKDVEEEINRKKEKQKVLNNEYLSLQNKLTATYKKLPENVVNEIKRVDSETNVNTDLKGRKKLIELMKNRLTVLDGLKTKDEATQAFENAIMDMISFLDNQASTLEKIQSETTENINDIMYDRDAEFTKAAAELNIKGLGDFLSDEDNEFYGNSDYAIDNKIADIIKTILKDDKCRIENLSCSNFEKIIDARDEITPEIIKTKRQSRSPYNIYDQAEFEEDAQSGAHLKALSVVRDTFLSICNTVKPYLNEDHAITIKYSKSGKYGTNIENFKKNFNITPDDKHVIVTDDDNYFYVKYDRFGWSVNNLNSENMILTSYSSQTTAHILDNIKEGNIPNVNLYSFQVYKMFPDLGIDYIHAIAFMMQPGVTYIIDEYNNANSIYNKSNFNAPVYSALKRLASEMNAHLKTDINTNGSTDYLIESIANAQIPTETGTTYFIEKENIDKFVNDGHKKKLDKILALDFDELKKGIDAEEFSINDFKYKFISIVQFNELYKTSTAINNYARVLNPDKFGAKKSIYETTDVFRNIQNIIDTEDNPVLYVGADKTHILQAIYPGITKSEGNSKSVEATIDEFITSDDTNSAYPSLFYFLKYATAPSIKVSKAIFPTQSIKMERVYDSLSTILERRIDYKTRNAFEKFVNNIAYRQNEFSLGHIVCYNNDNLIHLQNDPREEILRIYGLNRNNNISVWETINETDENGKPKEYQVEEQFDVKDINNITDRECELFATLSPAQKVAWIQRKYENAGVFDFFDVNLNNKFENDINIKNTQTIKVKESNVEPAYIRSELYKLMNHSNPLIRATIIDLLKYAYVVEGKIIKRNIVSKVIPYQLEREFNLKEIYNQKINNTITPVETYIRRFNNLEDYNNEKLAESFLRGRYKELPTYVKKYSIPEYKENSEKNNVIQKINTTFYNDEKTIDKSYKLVRRKFGDIFIENTDEDIIEDYRLKTTKYLNLSFNGENRLYKVLTLPNGTGYYLYPLDDLNKNEFADIDNFKSINPNNNHNDILIPEFYEAVFNAITDPSSRIKVESTYKDYEFKEVEILSGTNSKTGSFNDFVKDHKEEYEDITKRIEKSKNYRDEKETNKKGAILIDSKTLYSYMLKHNMNEIVAPTNNPYQKYIIRKYIPNSDVKRALNTILKYFKSEDIEDKNIKGFINNVKTVMYNLNRQNVLLDINTKEALKLYIGKKFPINTRSNEYAYYLKAALDAVNNNKEEIHFPNNFFRVTEQTESQQSSIGEFDFTESDINTASNSAMDQMAKEILKNSSEANNIVNFYTNAYSRIKSNYINKNDKYAGEISQELASYGIMPNAVSVNKNIEMASEIMTRYVNDKTEEFKAYLNEFMETEIEDDNGKVRKEYAGINSYEVQEALEKDPKMRNKILKAIMDIEAFIEDFEIPSLIHSNDPNINGYFEQIRKCINELKNNNQLDMAKRNMIDNYIKRLSNNPLVRLDLVNLTEGLYSTSYLESMFHGAQENPNPLIQIILKEVMSDIYAAEMEGKEDAEEFYKKAKAFLDKGADFNHFIDEIGKFKVSYSDKLITDRKEIVKKIFNYDNPRSKERLLAELELEQWTLNNLQQRLPDEFYETNIELKRRIINSEYFPIYQKYLEYQQEINEINKRFKNGELDEEDRELRKELYGKIYDLRRPFDPTGIPKISKEDPEFKANNLSIEDTREAAAALNKFLKDMKANKEKFIKYEAKAGFWTKLEECVRIIDKYERKDVDGFNIYTEEQLENEDKYMEAKEWIRKNAIKNDANSEIAKKLINAYTALANNPRGQRISYISFIKNLAHVNKAYDFDGIIDGRKFTDEKVKIIKQQQGLLSTMYDVDGNTEEGLISYNKDRGEVVVFKPEFYEAFGVKIRFRDNGTYRAAVNKINEILRPHYNHTEGKVLLNELTVSELKELNRQYNIIKEFKNNGEKRDNKYIIKPNWNLLKKLFDKGEIFKNYSAEVNLFDTKDVLDTKLNDIERDIRNWFTISENGPVRNPEDWKQGRLNILNRYGISKSDFKKATGVDFKEDDIQFLGEAGLSNLTNLAKNNYKAAFESVIYDYYFEEDADKNITNVKKVYNRYLFPSVLHADTTKPEVKPFIDEEKTNALRYIKSHTSNVPTKYWYIAKNEMKEKYGEDSEEYKEWYHNNTILNVKTHKLEPICIWMSNEIINDEIKNKNLDTEEGINSFIDRVHREYSPKPHMQHNVLTTQNENYIDDNTYESNIKDSSKYILPDTMSEADKGLKKLTKDYITKLAINPTAARILKTHMPIQPNYAIDNTAKFIAEQVGSFAGVLPGTKGDGNFYENISYARHANARMPMTELIRGKGWLEVKTPKPNRDECKDNKEYEEKLKTYMDEVEAVKKHNDEITSKIINKDWINVMRDFIQRAYHYNAVDYNKYLLFFGLDLLKEQKTLVTNTGWDKFIKRAKMSSEEREEYVTKTDENAISQYTTFARRLLYEQFKRPNKKYTQMAAILQNMQASKFMMLNVNGAIANVTVGGLGIVGEILAGEFFNTKDVIRAERSYLRNSLSMIADMYKETSSSVEDAIIKYFNIVDFDEIAGIIPNANPRIIASRLRSLAFGLQTGGEHMMQNVALFAMLDSHRLYKTDDGKLEFRTLNDVRLNTSYAALKEALGEEKFEDFLTFVNKISKNQNAKKDYVRFRKDAIREYLHFKCDNKEKEKYEKIYKKMRDSKEKEFYDNDKHPTVKSQFELGSNSKLAIKKDSMLGSVDKKEQYKLLGTIKNRTISVNHKIHGMYDKLNAAQIEQYWWGGVLMQYHKHLPMGILKRYRSQGYFNESRGTVEKGMYKSFIDFFSINHRELKKVMKEADYTDEEITAIRSVKQIIKNYITMATNFKLYWNLTPEYDRANMKRAMAGVAGVLSAICLTIALKCMGEDDDKKKRGDSTDIMSLMYNLGIYEADRFASEAWMYCPIGMINESKKLWNSPTASNSTLNDMWKGCKFIMEAINPLEDYEPEFKTGIHAGENKITSTLGRQIPIYRNLQATKNLKKNNHYFKLDSNILSIIPDSWGDD